MEILISTPWKKRFMMWSVLLLGISAGTRPLATAGCFWPRQCQGCRAAREVLCHRKQKTATKWDPHLTLNPCFDVKKRNAVGFHPCTEPCRAMM